MFAQSGWHRGCVREQGGEDGLIRGDDGIISVEHIERRCASVSVNYVLHAVADVVDWLIAEPVTSRVWVGIGRSKGVHKPVNSAVLADDDVRVGVCLLYTSDAAD